MKKIILIDNDQLIQKSWQFAATKAGEDLDCFIDVQTLVDAIDIYSPKETTIYIDSDLDDGLKGEVEAKKLFELGFTELYMASGKTFNTDDLPSYIKGNVSKRAPF